MNVKLVLVLLLTFSVLSSSVYSTQWSYPLALTYQKVSEGSFYLDRKSWQNYHELVKSKASASTNIIAKVCKELTAVAESASSSVRSLEKSYLPNMNSLVEKLSDKHRRYLDPKLSKLKAISKKLRENPAQFTPKDEAEAVALLQNVRDFMDECQLEELQLSGDVTWTDTLKYYVFKLINIPFKVVIVCLGLLITSGKAFTALSIFITLVAVYYAYKKTLDFLKVLWFFVKVPFRLVRAIFVFIWRLVFRSKDTPNELEFDFSEEQIRKECACTCVDCKTPPALTHGSESTLAKAPRTTGKKALPRRALLSNTEVQAPFLVSREEEFNLLSKETTADSALQSSSMFVSTSLTAVVLAVALLL